MRCRDVRAHLVRLAPGAVPDAAIAAHLETCPECAALATAFLGVRAALAEQKIVAEPDGGFSARVLARLRRADDPVDALGWAAARFLPLAAALALVLMVWAASVPTPLGVEALLAGGVSDDALAAFVVSAPETAP